MRPLSKAKAQILEAWSHARERAKEALPVINEERDIRKKVIQSFFPHPQEGSNQVELPHSWFLHLTYKIERKVDEAAFLAMRPKLLEEGISPDDIVRWVPALNTRAYKKLSDEQRHLVDQVLTIKPGSPSLDLIPPEEEE